MISISIAIKNYLVGILASIASALAKEDGELLLLETGDNILEEGE